MTCKSALNLLVIMHKSVNTMSLNGIPTSSIVKNLNFLKLSDICKLETAKKMFCLKSTLR